MQKEDDLILYTLEKYKCLIYKTINTCLNTKCNTNLSDELFTEVYYKIYLLIKIYCNKTETKYKLSTLIQFKVKQLVYNKFKSEKRKTNLLHKYKVKSNTSVRDLFEHIMSFTKTEREKEIINLKLQGYKLKEIANLLNISECAVSKNIDRIRKRFEGFEKEELLL